MSILFLLLIFLCLFPVAPTAIDLILLNCGGDASKSTDMSSRSWVTDDLSEYVPENAAGLSSTSAASHMHPSVPDLVPYQTARIFHSPFTYSFHVSTGHKFIRLYFYPDTYAGFNTAQSFFSVTANGFRLLSNFSAFLHSQKSNPSFMKEFVVYVEGNNQRIDLTFSPNPKSFAFINGIEIVHSLPDDLYFRDRPIKFLPGQLHYLKNDTALETLYRLNTGGADVQIRDDSGMFRYWKNDYDYIYGADVSYTPHDENHTIQYTKETPAYSAPKIVYRTSRTMGNTSKSLEWAFPVDSGFYYLLRFHFCEIQLEITKQNQRVFTITVDNKIAEIQADVIFWTGGTGIPIFRDYITWVHNDGRHGQKDLRLSLFPNNEGSPLYSNALLNGLEIFKLSDANQSLAAANPELMVANSSPPFVQEKKKDGPSSSAICGVVGSVVGVLVVVAALSFLISRRLRKAKVHNYYQVIKDTNYDSIKT